MVEVGYGGATRARGVTDTQLQGGSKLVDTGEKGVRDRAREAKRYREAAELALDQLQWAINYLYRIRKFTIAERLERNREHILGELRTGR
jgi:hypothetical protein